MRLDVKSRRERLKEDKININLVPFIDILFTILIFVIVTSSFANTAVDQSQDNPADSATGKLNVTDTSGNREYYIIPVQGLSTVTVNGQDMSSYIQDDAIAIHSRVIDEGQINVDNKHKAIIITAPAGMNPNDAVRSPNDGNNP